MNFQNTRAFKDRRDAGARLAAALAEHRFESPVVLGIPRGGVVVSVEVATRLRADHGVAVARKLGAPYQPELAVGAISATGSSYVNQALAREVGADERYLAQEMARETERARRYEDSFDSHRRPPVAGRDVIVVDDGVATGATAIAAVRAMKQESAKRVIFAVPVGPPHTIDLLRREADEVICLIEDSYFMAVGQFYRDFQPVEDDEVKALVDAFVATAPASAQD